MRCALFKRGRLFVRDDSDVYETIISFHVTARSLMALALDHSRREMTVGGRLLISSAFYSVSV